MPLLKLSWGRTGDAGIRRGGYARWLGSQTGKRFVRIRYIRRLICLNRRLVGRSAIILYRTLTHAGGFGFRLFPLVKWPLEILPRRRDRRDGKSGDGGRGGHARSATMLTAGIAFRAGVGHVLRSLLLHLGVLVLGFRQERVERLLASFNRDKAERVSVSVLSFSNAIPARSCFCMRPGKPVPRVLLAPQLRHNPGRDTHCQSIFQIAQPADRSHRGDLR